MPIKYQAGAIVMGTWTGRTWMGVLVRRGSWPEVAVRGDGYDETAPRAKLRPGWKDELLLGSTKEYRWGRDLGGAGGEERGGRKAGEEGAMRNW
jgi:hypothetical protein